MTAAASSLYDVVSLEREARALRQLFDEARPFPHLVLEGHLRLTPQEVDASFPPVDWDGWNPLGDRYQKNKRGCSSIERIPEPLASLIVELNGPRFLRSLESLTGIKQLLPDPYLVGGGLHLSGPGGILSPHTDFHRYRALNLYRRINVLVYLNQDWTEEDGGCLTLFDGDRPVKTVIPSFGTTVIFRTDDRSVHGFPEPVADGKWRRSVALYYYTAAPAPEFSGDETTYWRQHGKQKGLVRRVRFTIYQALLNVSRAVSIAAHLVNPNQGAGLVKATLARRRNERRAASRAAS